MFKKLKNKLKEWSQKVSKVEETEEETTQEIEEIKTPKKENITNKPDKKQKKEKAIEKPEETPKKESNISVEEEDKEKKKGFIKKIFSKKEKEIDLEETKELTDKEVDKKLKKELEKDKFKEPEKIFNAGMKTFIPDLDKTTAITHRPREALKEKAITHEPHETPKEEAITDKPEEELEQKKTTTDKPKKETQNIEPSGQVEELDSLRENKEKEEPKQKKSLFKKLTSKTKTISEDEFSNYSEDLEMILLENNVALEVAEKIIEELKQSIVGKELSKKEIEETITNSLKNIIENVLIEPFDIIKEIKEKDSPYIILFCGINGTGKTTHIAKVANMLKEKGITSAMAAGDTFRAAAVEQLKKHGENLDIKVIAHDYGSDPAAVGFDAIKYAKKNNIQAVLIDTAGRIHTATNLLQEMQKIKKVTNPDKTIFVGESITGNDATDQVKAFNDNIGIDGIILSKADIDEKGGTALSVGYTTNKPIIFLGTGQNYKDIEPFDKKKFLEKLELE